MDKKAKIIIIALSFVCVLLLCTSVSYLIGSRRDNESEAATVSVSPVSEFISIEKVGYAAAGTPIYREPDTGSEVIATVGEGEVILLIGQAPGWFRCMVGQTVGYIPAGNIKDAMEAAQAGIDASLYVGGGIDVGGVGDISGGGEEETLQAPVAPTAPQRTTTAAPPSTLVTTAQQTTNYAAAANNMLSGINDARAENGLPALTMDSGLANKALSEATTAAKQGSGQRLSSVGGAYRIGTMSDLTTMAGITKAGIAVVEGKGGFYYSIKYQ